MSSTREEERRTEVDPGMSIIALKKEEHDETNPSSSDL
jgi:hypothetical protein